MSRSTKAGARPINPNGGGARKDDCSPENTNARICRKETQKNAIESQKGVVSQREEEVSEARQSLLEATQDLKALEKHREKWEKKVQREINLKEEDALDELAQTIFLNKDKG